jgi:hypothetical protein
MFDDATNATNATNASQCEHELEVEFGIRSTIDLDSML